ncbi:MAG: hypothetical protein IPN26_10490 [Bacteroidetes bacterium]|nr:hypothetical protein [Bacteroidota bacterium]
MHQELCYGNSFLTNLTSITPIKTESSLEEIFTQAHARYKILFKDQWLCFRRKHLSKFWMAIYGPFNESTIDAGIPILRKLFWKMKRDGRTLYDCRLIRNDLSRVAREVKVDRFRYLDEIKQVKKIYCR